MARTAFPTDNEALDGDTITTTEDTMTTEDTPQSEETRQTTLSGGKKTRVGHCKKDAYDVYIGRGDRGDAHLLNTPIGTQGWLGNPFPGSEYSRTESIERFRAVFEARLADDDEFRIAIRELTGQILGCWCQRLGNDGPGCHGEVIAKWTDRLAGGHEC